MVMWQVWVMSMVSLCVSTGALTYYKGIDAYLDVKLGVYKTMTTVPGYSAPLCAVSCRKRNCMYFSYEGNECTLGGIGLHLDVNEWKFSSYAGVFPGPMVAVTSVKPYIDDSGVEYLPENAVDGNLQTHFISDRSVKDPWWQIDLEKPCRVLLVYVIPRQEDIALGRFQNIWVGVQNSSSSKFGESPIKQLRSYQGPLTTTGAGVSFEKEKGIVGDKISIHKISALSDDDYLEVAQVMTFVENVRDL